MLLLLTLACAVEPAADTATPDFSHDLNNGLEIVQGQGESGITPIPHRIIPVYVGPAPSGLSDPLWRQEVQVAFAQWEWAMQGRKRFEEVVDPDDAAVVLTFAEPTHREPCDQGFSETSLAHAFTWDSPCVAGVIHLNAGRRWVLNQSDAPDTFDLRYAVMHELGHVLGLGHHDGPGRLMSTSYAGPIHQLDEHERQDILAVLDGETP